MAQVIAETRSRDGWQQIVDISGFDYAALPLPWNEPPTRWQSWWWLRRERLADLRFILRQLRQWRP